MLTAYEEKDGISLLGGTGVTEEDLLQAIPVFMKWMETNKKANILRFFTTAHMKGRIVSAFAVIGFKAVLSELNAQVEKDDKEN